MSNVSIIGPGTPLHTLLHSLAYTAVWLFLFGMTVELGITHFYTEPYGATNGPLIGSAVNIILLIAVLWFQRKWIFQHLRITAWWEWALYAVAAIAAAALPFHYSITETPVGVYIVAFTVSVLWQNIITFGYWRHYVREVLGPIGTSIMAAIIFPFAHAFWIPGFTADKPVMLLLSSVMAVLFTWLAELTGKLHLPIFIHLMLYFIMA